MDVHLRDLRYFVAVAEELHFTRAAERLFMSQPALSRQIAKLERQLRVTLLERGRHRAQLTEAGSVLLEHAQGLLGSWDATRREVSDVAAASASILRVGLQTSVGRGIFAQLSAALRDRRPNWRIDPVQVDWEDPTSGLADGTTDLAIVWLPIPGEEQFRWIVIATEPRLVAVPITHPLAGATEVTFAQIADETFVALPDDASSARDYWLATEHRHRPVTIGSVAHTAEEAFEAIAAGLGIALVSEGNATLYDRGDVTGIPVVDLRPSQLALAWRADDHRDVLRDVTELAAQRLNKEGLHRE